MHFFYPALLFALTLAGGSIPLWFKGLNDKRMQLLLAFSGAFLLSITFLHLLPETFHDFEHKLPGEGHSHTSVGAGFYILGGFFLQLFIQRFTHGVEHGHVHVHHSSQHDHVVPVWSIVAGLSIHAFMEGLPLGFNYRNAATGTTIYLAVAAHKLPEAMLLAMLVNHAQGRRAALYTLLIFALLTPLAGLIATYLGTHYGFVSRLVTALIPVVAGAFIHIATTIFFESGTKHHLLNWQKVMAMATGAGIALITLFLE